MDLAIDRVASPIGEIMLVADGRSLISLDFTDYDARLDELLKKRYGEYRLRPTADPLGASARLGAYFAGRLDAFDGFPIAGGGTDFQARVWQALREIPPGRTETYSGLAARLGHPKAFR